MIKKLRLSNIKSYQKLLIMLTHSKIQDWKEILKWQFSSGWNFGITELNRSVIDPWGKKNIKAVLAFKDLSKPSLTYLTKF